MVIVAGCNFCARSRCILRLFHLHREMEITEGYSTHINEITFRKSVSKHGSQFCLPQFDGETSHPQFIRM